MFEYIEELSQKVKDLEKQSQKINGIERELKLQNKHFKFILILVSAIVVVCFLTFILVSLDYFKFSAERQKHFYDKLEQKDKEINALNSRLDKFEDKLKYSQDTTSKK